jgi:hypothetical protein
MQRIFMKGTTRCMGAGIRAVPSGDKAVVVFHVDDEARQVTVLVVNNAGQDWGRRNKK